jgi:hypothetical protein
VSWGGNEETFLAAISEVSPEGDYSMKTKNRFVKAHREHSGFVIYRLLQGLEKQRVVHAFAYATHHCIWFSVHGLNSQSRMMIPEDAAIVKERIGRWRS